MFSRVSVKPNVCHGQVCIKGTRIPVHQVVQMLASGDTIDELLESFPTITKEDILECLRYASYLAEEQITPIERVVLG